MLQSELHLIFVDLSIKVNGVYYYGDVLLSERLLPVMRRVSGDLFTLQHQQDSAEPPRTEHATRSASLNSLEQATPAFISADI